MQRIIFIIYTALAVVCSAMSQVNTDQVMRIGQNALYFEDYMLSIQYFNQAIQSKPYLAQPYFMRAIAKLNLEDYDGAVADASKAIELNPFITDAWEVRGVARQNLGDNAGAVADYDHALNLVPRNRQLLFNKALAQMEIEKYQGADSTYSELLRYYPNFDNGYLGRAQLLLAQADTTAARADIDHALQINPKSATAYVMRSELAIKQGQDYESAVKDLDEAIRLQPKYTNLYINRAFLRYYLDDYFGAMADYDYALGLEPYNATALFNRALLLTEVNANDRALADLNSVLDLDPDNIQARYIRATVHGKKGLYREGVADIDKVIEQYPDYPGAWFMRSQFCRELKQNQRAEHDYRKAMALAKAIPLDGVAVPDPATTVADAAEAEARKFNKLLTVENTAEIEEEYNNQAIRGKVQDRQLQVETAPLMELAYYFTPDELGENTYYVKEVDDLNSSRQLRFRMVVATNDPVIDESIFDAHRQSVDYYNSYLSGHRARAVDYLGRAMDFVTLRDYENALRDTERAIELTPDYALSYFLRGQIRHRMMRIDSHDEAPDAVGRSAMRRAALEQALADYNKVVELSPRMAPAWFDKGNLHLELGDYTSAISAYSRALELAPAMGQAYYNRGYIYLKSGNRRAGIADLSKAGEMGILPAYNLIKRMSN